MKELLGLLIRLETFSDSDNKVFDEVHFSEVNETFKETVVFKYSGHTVLWLSSI